MTTCVWPRHLMGFWTARRLEAERHRAAAEKALAVAQGAAERAGRGRDLADEQAAQAAEAERVAKAEASRHREARYGTGEGRRRVRARVERLACSGGPSAGEPCELCDS